MHTHESMTNDPRTNDKTAAAPGRVVLWGIRHSSFFRRWGFVIRHYSRTLLVKVLSAFDRRIFPTYRLNTGVVRRTHRGQVSQSPRCTPALSPVVWHDEC